MGHFLLQSYVETIKEIGMRMKEKEIIIFKKKTITFADDWEFRSVNANKFNSKSKANTGLTGPSGNPVIILSSLYSSFIISRVSLPATKLLSMLKPNRKLIK